MQSDSNDKRMWKAIKDCYRKEGIRGFYKGMGFPAASAPFIYAVVFGMNEVSKVALNYHDENSFIEGN